MRFKEFKWIPLNQLRVSDENIRKSMIEREKSKLKRSIKQKGILDAIVVYYNENDQVYEIVKGQRRFLAAKELNEEGYPIKELPCLVKEAEEPCEATEESLLDELMRQAVEPDDTGKAILSLAEKKYGGSVESVGQALGVDFQWLDWYVGRLALNPPAKTEEEKELPKTEQKKVTLETFTQNTPLNTLSLEEKKELERRIQENPKKPLPLAISEVKMWRETTREVMFALDEKTCEALATWCKEPKKEHEVTIKVKIPGRDNPVSLRRGLDILVNELLKALLKEEKYM